MPPVSPVIDDDVVATAKLLYPATKEVNAASVATSRKYPEAPVTATQFAVNPVCVIALADEAVGMAGIVICEMVFDEGDDPVAFTEFTR